MKTLSAGAVTGAIAGLIMAVVVMVVFWLFLGKSPLYPVQVIGSVVFGEKALEGLNIGALVAGLVIHMVIAIIWGVVFGIIAGVVSINTSTMALICGLVLGAVTMVDAYFIVPMVMKATAGSDIWNREVPMNWDWAAHLVFGVCFVFYPSVRRKLSA